jgi:chemotaxis signal transduction protein
MNVDAKERIQLSTSLGFPINNNKNNNKSSQIILTGVRNLMAVMLVEEVAKTMRKDHVIPNV